MRRRDLIAGSLALPFAGRGLYNSLISPASAQEKGAPFEAQTVRALARDLAAKPYQAPDNKLPDVLKDLTYDRYRMIRFKPDQALWKADGLPFQLQMFHRGFYYANRVDLYEVKDGVATPIVYGPEMFSSATNLRPTCAISASRASAFTGRSTGRIISTRSACSSARAISARCRKARSTGFRRAACR